MARAGGTDGTGRWGAFGERQGPEHGRGWGGRARNELAHTDRPSPLPGDLDWPHRRTFLGQLPVDPLRLTEAAAAVAGLVEAGRGGAVFLNTADSLVLAERDPALRAALHHAELSLADGQRLMWAAESLGTPLPGDVPALELLPPLLSLAARLRWRVFMLGEDAVALEASAAHLEKLYGVRVVGTYAPCLAAGVDDELAAQTARALLRTSPQLVLSALPSPAQELLLDRVKDRVRPGVVVGLGAALQALVGRVWRAPRWVEAARLGWVVRLFGGPRRLGRRGLWRDARFLWVFARVLLRRRRQKGGGGAGASEIR